MTHRRPRGRRGTGERIYELTKPPGWTSIQPHSSFPDRALVSLDYWNAVRVSPGVVTSSDTVYLINSLFDPEYTGVGHQPRDFDTWSTIYAKYRVRRVLVEVQVRQRAAHGIAVACVPSNSATALSASDAPLEFPRAVDMGITSSSQPAARAKFVVDPRAVLGMTPTEFLGDDATAALVSASPTQAVYLHIYAGQLDSATACDYELNVRFRFETEFYDRKPLSISTLISELRTLRSALGLDENGDEAPRPPPPTPASAQEASSSPLHPPPVLVRGPSVLRAPVPRR